MQVKNDEAWEAFSRLSDSDWFEGVRIKEVRREPLSPGGRARMTLFEQVGEEGRPHPRMRIEFPPASDPAPPETLIEDPEDAPADAESFAGWLDEALKAAGRAIDEVPEEGEPDGSPRYWKNSLRAQRIERFFSEAEGRLTGWIEEGTIPAEAADDAHYALHSAAAMAHSGRMRYDDADTGTYHSYGHDAPFVHHLEQMLETLPAKGSDGYALLDEEQQRSVDRQRGQVRNHLDHLMRHKYAHDGITETDIERTLGGFLIDRESRHMVSETRASLDSLTPAYETLRVSPEADHEAAGAWVYRNGAGALRREDDGAEVEGADELLLSTPVDAGNLSFRRAPGDERLREGVRLDWDGSGYLQDEEIGWVGWAGHCDIKAVMECLGITLHDEPSVAEYRSDTGQTTTYDRDLLVEMVAATMELGSVYRRADGGGHIQRGVHHFGGARNDSRPDRLQFLGPAPGKSFRWPLGGRKDAFVVKGIERDGEELDVGRVFFRHLPDEDALDFAPNPAFLKTVEQDYNLIDVSGAVLQAKVEEEGFHETTGYPIKKTIDTVVDLRPEPETQRCYLGTAMKDAARRELYRVYLDHEESRLDAVLERWERNEESGKYEPVEVPEELVHVPLVTPFQATLSHEMKRDDPAMFQALLDLALRQAQNICADTDMKSAVWNGVVTRIDAERKGENRDARVEHWRVVVKARFGSATLDYLVRRAPDGLPVEFCPVSGEEAWDSSPDFLWQDIPDVASKGIEPGEGGTGAPSVWVINETMLERDIVTVAEEPDIPGGFYVYDDQVKNVFELLFCGLGGYPYTVVHHNKRFGFADRASWTAAVEKIDELRSALEFSAD